MVCSPPLTPELELEPEPTPRQRAWSEDSIATDALVHGNTEHGESFGLFVGDSTTIRFVRRARTVLLLIIVSRQKTFLCVVVLQ